MPLDLFHTMIILRILLLPLLIANLLADDHLQHLSGSGISEATDRFGFTQTQKWAPEFTKWTRQRPKYLLRDWDRKISLSHPPANSSPRTQAEVTYLESLRSQRTDKMKEISAEAEVTNFRLGTHLYSQLTTNPKYPATTKLIQAAYHDLAIATFTFKQKFNRIRPSILQKDLGHAIAIPKHPAYPSGHATGAYTFAYLLQELDPEKAETYRKDAQRIALNREIAGLHYPSDTEAGRLLARQLVDHLMQNPRFKQLFIKAQKEW